MTTQNLMECNFEAQGDFNSAMYVRQDMVDTIMSILEDYNLEKVTPSKRYTHSRRITDIGYELLNCNYDELDRVIDELEEVSNITLFNHIDENIVDTIGVDLANLKHHRTELEKFDDAHGVEDWDLSAAAEEMGLTRE